MDVIEVVLLIVLFILVRDNIDIVSYDVKGNFELVFERFSKFFFID